MNSIATWDYNVWLYLISAWMDYEDGRGRLTNTAVLNQGYHKCGCLRASRMEGGNGKGGEKGGRQRGGGGERE